MYNLINFEHSMFKLLLKYLLFLAVLIGSSKSYLVAEQPHESEASSRSVMLAAKAFDQHQAQVDQSSLPNDTKRNKDLPLLLIEEEKEKEDDDQHNSYERYLKTCRVILIHSLFLEDVSTSFLSAYSNTFAKHNEPAIYLVLQVFRI